MSRTRRGESAGDVSFASAAETGRDRATVVAVVVMVMAVVSSWAPRGMTLHYGGGSEMSARFNAVVP